MTFMFAFLGKINSTILVITTSNSEKRIYLADPLSKDNILNLNYWCDGLENIGIIIGE